MGCLVFNTRKFQTCPQPSCQNTPCHRKERFTGHKLSWGFSMIICPPQIFFQWRIPTKAFIRIFEQCYFVYRGTWFTSFSNVLIVKTILLLKISILFKSRARNVCALEAVVSALRAVNFKVNLCKVILLNGIKVRNMFLKYPK